MKTLVSKNNSLIRRVCLGLGILVDTLIWDKTIKDNSIEPVGWILNGKYLIGKCTSEAINELEKNPDKYGANEKFKKDITPKELKEGQRFDKLLVVSFSHLNKVRTNSYLCRCDCGKQKIVAEGALTRRRIRSCGCFKQRRPTLSNNGSIKAKLLRAYKLGATKRSFSFEIDKESFYKLLDGNCYYCNGSPKNKSGDYFYNGVDRIDNLKGYSVDNCVSCCYNCNSGKSNKTKEQFLQWIKEVYDFSIKETDNKV